MLDTMRVLMLVLAAQATAWAMGSQPPSGSAGTTSTSTSGPQAYQESNGQVVMQAEGYDQRIARNGQSWDFKTAKSGYSGSGYLQALPNSGVNRNTGYTTSAPELVYNVLVSTPGTYYVWIRGQGDSGNDDSLHAGGDGLAPSTADRISSFNYSSWVWKNTTMDGQPATLAVATPGLHTFHLWMREDGLRVDKILLRTSSSSTAPSGSGPAVSPRVAISDTIPPQVTISSPADGAVITVDP